MHNLQFLYIHSLIIQLHIHSMVDLVLLWFLQDPIHRQQLVEELVANKFVLDVESLVDLLVLVSLVDALALVFSLVMM